MCSISSIRDSARVSVPEYYHHNKGCDAAISIGHIPIHHKHKLREHNDKHKVGTQDKQIINAAVEDGEESGDQTVEGNKNVQGPENFFLGAVGTQHFVIKVSETEVNVYLIVEICT